MLATLGIIGGFLGIGAALDRVISDDAKQTLFNRAPLFTSDNRPKGRLVQISDAVATLFFNKTNFNSLIIVAAASILVLIFVNLFQYYNYGSNVFETSLEGLDGIYDKVIFFSILLISIIVTDIFSFLQTKIMIGLTRNCRNIFEVLVVIIAEIVTTITVFSVIFSVGLLALIAFVNSRSEWRGQVAVEISEASDRQGLTVQYEPLSELIEARTATYAVTLHPTNRPNDYVQGTFYVYSNGPISDDQILLILQDESDDRMFLTKFEKASGDLRYRYELAELEPITYSALAEFDMPGNIRLQDLDFYYTSAFSASDSVQDSFPGSIIYFLPGWYRLWTLDLQAQTAIESTRPGNIHQFPAYCLDSGELAHVQEMETLRSCQRWVVASSFPTKDLQYSIRFWWYGDRGNVPIFTAFVSSMTMTIIVYVLYASVLIVGTNNPISTGAERIAWLKTKEHPFTIALGAIGLLIGLISLAYGVIFQ